MSRRRGRVVLIALQPDLGTALVISFTMAALLIAAGLPLRQLALVAAVGALVVLFALVEPYRRARLTAFLDPGTTPATASSPSRARSRSAPAGSSASAWASRCRRSSTCRRPHGLHPRRHRRGARPRGDHRTAALYGIIAYAGLRDRPKRQRRVRLAAGRRPDLADPVPGAAQRLHRARPRAADRRPAPVHLLRLDVADRPAGADGAAAQRRRRRAAHCGRSEPELRARRVSSRDRGS